jgi:tripartite ATP-independent transporter DctM subunit
MIVYGGLVIGLVALIMIGMPVGFGAGVISAIGGALIFDGMADPRVAAMLARVSLDKIDNFLLLSIPFFLLAGRLMNTGGITERLFGFVSVVVRPLKGGVAHANVLASMLFAGMSGSATADAAGLGQIEMKAMTSQGYKPEFSAGVTAASSLLGPIIPPSIALVAYAVQAEQSVAQLFVAAIIPGILMAAADMAYVSYKAHKHNFPSGPFAGFGEIWRSFRSAALAIATPGIIMGGIYFGIFTPTEAAAVAALYAVILGLFVYREFNLRALAREVRGTMIDTGVIMLIIAFTSAFGDVMIRAQVPTELAAMLTRLTDDPTVLMLLMIVFWLVVGCFMAQTPAILILTPILLPIAEQYEIDPIFFGIIMTMTLTLGLLTPPVGMVLYVLVRVTGIPFERLAIIALPYVFLTTALILFLVLVPDLVMFPVRLLF